ncbi:inovirus-type Gp2 protein [Pseudomonas extremaustralis]|uniref:YagK/YfjJ domain-containing protein n=1 Tax=Pseudomonas extremaustralis TaxID=359110 RepID=UPI002410ADD1|nr:inovirus-type Gp2 protein [Pseudomonas extremaustralis]MDG2967846.1 inovirus-type Gp2 protein [Pseudomonas extremaustralis]
MLNYYISEFITPVNESLKNSLSQDEILKGNLEDFLNGVGGNRDEPKNVEGFNAISDVTNVIDTTIRLLGSAQKVFTADSWVVGGSLKLKSLALSVSTCIRTDFSRISDLFPHSEFNPYFKLFKDQVEALDPRLLGMYKLTHPLSQAEWGGTVAELNNFVSEIRKRANQAEFVKLMEHHARNTNKNQAGLHGYIDKLFDYYPRLLVVRVDLSYQKASVLASRESISHKEANDHRVKLLNDIRYRLFKECYVGFAWKLEYGLMSSLHYHLLLFLDGSKIRLDVRVAKIVGEHWKTVVTCGRGRYWNCNANKAGYGAFCGLGMISHNDKVLRGNLRKAANYLVKCDYFVRSAIPSGRRTFGKGIPPARTKSNRGRPRKG